MKFVSWMRALTLVSALLASLCIAASASADSGSGLPFTNVAIYGQTNTAITSISCFSAGDCVAVGYSISGGATGLIALETNGVWGASIPTTAPASSPEALLDAVSCQSSTSCEAAGIYEGAGTGVQSMVVPISISGSSVSAGTAVTLPLPTGFLNTSSQASAPQGISCAAGGCTIVGSYLPSSGERDAMVVSGAGTSWTATKVAAPTLATEGATLTSVSCPASGSCEAVGNYLNASGDIYPWAVELTGGVPGTAQPLPLPSNFVPATGTLFEPGVVELTNLYGMSAVSCPSSGVCTAAGTYPTASDPLGVVVPLTNGVAGTPIPIGALIGALQSIWCSDATDCVAGGLGFALTPTPAPAPATTTESAGVWSPLVSVSLTDSFNEGWMTALSCSAPQACAAAGIEEDTTSSPMVENSFVSNSVGILTSSLPAATIGVPYSATLQATGGIGSTTWSISPGSLPAGLSLNTATGVISGTPTALGQSGFIVNVSASLAPGGVDSEPMSLSVNQVSSADLVAKLKIAYSSTSGPRATIVLSCSVTRCSGKLAATGVEHLKGKTPTGVAASAHASRKSKGSRTITLAKGSYSLAAGATEVVKLKLSSKASQLLRQLHRISGYLKATPRGARKAAVIEKLTFES